MKFLMDPYQGLPLSFALRWCPQAWEQYRRMKDATKRELLMRDIELYCPDPCHGNPCRDLKNVNDSTKCTVIGPFENEFFCDCNKYSEWDPALLNCQLRNPCHSGIFSLCHPDNTLICIAKDTENIVCICKPEYMGSDCSVLRDACQERINKSQPNGYELCQVQYGNECHPVLGTDAFRCKCQFGYSPIFTISDDNCLARLDPCTNTFLSADLNATFSDLNEVARLTGFPQRTVTENKPTNYSRDQSLRLIRRGLTCLNGGKCMSSSDLTRSICVCRTSSEGDPLYKGKLTSC
ncbi:hypothetical protein D915_004338 [Fasciola hepatica]|uniref:EGF-like domain-containing protein n=1 Tax=Fasciola hepatica TaxID=6192 RepID=A0A4E0RC79_FASHE|nr:hypothetical protein D915_004338 [Fasciola hepatica]